jgi:hypothetical protein
MNRLFWWRDERKETRERLKRAEDELSPRQHAQRDRLHYIVLNAETYGPFDPHRLDNPNGMGHSQ